MNADRLLEHFERISDAADAVPRLRRFVLELAVQGRLTRPKDDSAPHCLTAKACSFPDADVWQIPTHWAFVELQQLAGSSGLLIDGDWVESKDQDPAGAIRLTQLADVGVGAFRDRSARFMNEETASRLGCTFLAPGDVLIARMPDPLGRACIFPGDKRPCVTVVDVAILRPNRDDIDPAFVVHAINSPVFAKNVAAKAAGTTRSRISRGNLAKLPFPLPPLAEQHSIVAKVDELMALCDRLETAQTEREARRDRLVSASLARTTEANDTAATSPTTSARFHLDHFACLTTRPKHVEQLRQTILNLAVRGQLVPQDESAPPAPTSLAINDEDHTSTESGARGTRYLETENERYPIPRSWVWTRLGSVGDWGSGTTPSRGNADYFDGDVSWFKSGELNDNQSLMGSGERITRLALEQCSFRRNGTGDVLFAMYGATIGKVAILAEPAVTNQAVVACTPCEYLFNRYLFLFLLSQRQRFHEASEGGAQPNVSKAKVIRCPMPLPPLAEQQRIVAKVDELMALCDQLEASLASAATDRARLLESLLHEALRRAA